MLKAGYHSPLCGKRRPISCLIAALIVALASPAGAEPKKKTDDKTASKAPAKNAAEKDGKSKPAEAAPRPCTTDPSRKGPAINTDKDSRFGANSPFDEKYQAPVVKKEKLLWADSWRWSKAPDLVVEKWLTDKPDTKDKYVLIEFWATWCEPCRRSIPLLNGFHKKFGDELVVIGVSDESEEDVRKMVEPKIEFFCGIDTKARVKNKLGVWGIPHVILIEPGGFVIWEGFPLQEGFELTEKTIEKVLEIGRKLRAKAAAKKNS